MALEQDNVFKRAYEGALHRGHAQEILGYDMNCVRLAKSPIFLDFSFLICKMRNKNINPAVLLGGLNERTYGNNTEFLTILAIK